MGRPVDFGPTYGQRPDQFRVDAVITRHEAAVLARALVQSPRHPYMDPSKVDKVSVEPIPGTNGTWVFAEALRASTVYEIDPGITPPDQIASVMEKIKRDGARLASNERRSGLTVIPGEGNTANMYIGQISGNGRDPHDMSAVWTHDEVTFQNGGPQRTVNVITALGIYRTNVDLKRGLERYKPFGYRNPDLMGRQKVKGKKF